MITSKQKFLVLVFIRVVRSAFEYAGDSALKLKMNNESLDLMTLNHEWIKGFQSLFFTSRRYQIYCQCTTIDQFSGQLDSNQLNMQVSLSIRYVEITHEIAQIGKGSEKQEYKSHYIREYFILSNPERIICISTGSSKIDLGLHAKWPYSLKCYTRTMIISRAVVRGYR